MKTFKDLKLTIELVPKTSWYSNVRSNVSKNKWDKIRKKAYLANDHRCEICNGIGPAHRTECHEIWEYNDETNVQKLTGFISLCPKCHQVKHAGLAQMRGKLNEVIEQLCKVNNMTNEEAVSYISESFVEYRRRSKEKWKLDISFLDTY